jgi:regulator of protease activity HflC (stomatin/prohibitin superfamily)
MLKRVKINVGKVGLVFRRGDYDGVLLSGVYWLTTWDKVFIYDLREQFKAPWNLDVLLHDAELQSLLDIIEVGDGELVLVYERGIFVTVLPSGRYVFWKNKGERTFQLVDTSKVAMTESIKLSVLEKTVVSKFVRIILVEDFEKGLLLINGKFDRLLEAGAFYFWKNSITLKVIKVDLRSRQMEISGQEMLTGDKAALRVNFIVQYKVVDIMKAIFDNKDYEKQLYVLVQLALRAFVGTYSLDEILEKKEAISEYVLDEVKVKSGSLGVDVQSCGVRDIILPGEVKDIMNQVLVAQKKAQANVIMRREETASTRSLLNTAKLMENNEMLFKLKEMEYVEKIAEKIGEITVSGSLKNNSETRCWLIQADALFPQPKQE